MLQGRFAPAPDLLIVRCAKPKFRVRRKDCSDWTSGQKGRNVTLVPAWTVSGIPYNC